MQKNLPPVLEFHGAYGLFPTFTKSKCDSSSSDAEKRRATPGSISGRQLKRATIHMDGPPGNGIDASDAIPELKAILPLRGQLVPMKTVQETQSQETTGEAYAAEINIKSANTILKVLDSAFPRDPSMMTSHLRRFAKAGQLPNSLKQKGDESPERSESFPPTIYVLIPPPLPDLSFLRCLISPYAPISTADGQKPSPINIKSTRILLQPPTSRERAEFWSREFWPTIYNPAAHPAAHSPPPTTLALTKKALEPKSGKYLALAKRVAKEAEDLGRGRPVGVVAVDPALADREDAGDPTGDELKGVVSVAGDARYYGNPRQDFGSQTKLPLLGDDREGGPEKHALMRLIAIIANRRLSEAPRTQSLSVSQHAPSPNQVIPLSPLESSFLHLAPTTTPDEKRETAQSDILPDCAPHGDTSIDLDSTPSSGPYLCTSLDIYSTHDPCLCCSMGMVLSRFRAVVYIKDESRIGLGGLASIGPSNSSENPSGYGLHWRRELNWRVIGFEFVEDEHEEKRTIEGRDNRFNA